MTDRMIELNLTSSILKKLEKRFKGAVDDYNSSTNANPTRSAHDLFALGTEDLINNYYDLDWIAYRIACFDYTVISFIAGTNWINDNQKKKADKLLDNAKSVKDLYNHQQSHR